MEMGIEFTAYLRYVAALIFVLALIWLASMVLKRSMGQRLGIKRAGEARLSISEVLPIDSRHRLVLIQFDDREHLIMVGHEQSVVISEGDAQESPKGVESRNKKEPVL